MAEDLCQAKIQQYINKIGVKDLISDETKELD